MNLKGAKVLVVSDIGEARLKGEAQRICGSLSLKFEGVQLRMELKE